ncbi:MAG TPA: hypothetical protein VK646_04225 [Actinomycetota bacterium]|nr:hypothetical protein [Actinomycetota bacterium]
MVTATKPYVVTDDHVVPREGVHSGWVTFAGLAFLIGAFANFFWGLAAVSDPPKVWLFQNGLLYSTFSTVGWAALIWSGVLLIGALLLFGRVSWAPIVGVVLATISVIFWLFAMPVFPLYALTVILIDAFVIYGLVAHGMVDR